MTDSQKGKRIVIPNFSGGLLVFLIEGLVVAALVVLAWLMSIIFLALI